MNDRLRRAQSSRLTAEPGTLDFLRQLLEIAQESDHPMDKALTKVLSKQMGEQICSGCCAKEVIIECATCGSVKVYRSVDDGT